MWEYNNSVLIYTSPDFNYSTSVACSGFISTIINKSPPYPNEWKILSPIMLDKYYNIYSSGGCIVFISNQLTTNINSIKVRFNNFIKTFKTDSGNIPVLALFATKSNCFAKPMSNLWKVLNFIYIKKEKPTPILLNSIYIGGNDGSSFLLNWKECIQKKYTPKKFLFKKDTDRAFAHNVGLLFTSITPFFYDKPEKNWKWNSKLIQYEELVKHNPSPNIEPKFEFPNKCFILIMGRPSSGKSVLSKRIQEILSKQINYNSSIQGLLTTSSLNHINSSSAITPVTSPNKYFGASPSVTPVTSPVTSPVTPSSGPKRVSTTTSVNLDILNTVPILNDKDITFNKTWDKKVTDTIFNNTTIIITQYATYKKRSFYISKAKKFEIPIYILYIHTPKNICKVLNNTKIQTSKKFDEFIYDEQHYAKWENSFEYPEYDSNDLTLIEYPMCIRIRPELKFKY